MTAIYRPAYERAYRLTQVLMKLLRLPRQHPSIREAYTVIWYRTAGLELQTVDQDGLYSRPRKRS